MYFIGVIYIIYDLLGCPLYKMFLDLLSSTAHDIMKLVALIVGRKTIGRKF